MKSPVKNIKKDFYVVYIPKKSNKVRKIYVPSKEHKTKLREILENIYEENINLVTKMQYAFGFMKGLSVADACIKHINYNYTLKLDIENFFDSINNRHIIQHINSVYAHILFQDKHLPQGFPTSPFLSNVAMINIDNEIVTELQKTLKNFVYTRYADDLIFSYNTQTTNTIATDIFIMSIVSEILNKHNLKLNHNKTCLFTKKYGNRPILGISVSDKLYLKRKHKRRMRLMKHILNSKFIINDDDLNIIYNRYTTFDIMKIEKIRKHSDNTSLLMYKFSTNRRFHKTALCIISNMKKGIKLRKIKEYLSHHRHTKMTMYKVTFTVPEFYNLFIQINNTSYFHIFKLFSIFPVLKHMLINKKYMYKVIYNYTLIPIWNKNYDIHVFNRIKNCFLDIRKKYYMYLRYIGYMNFLNMIQSKNKL